jgi:hypothetical protein
MAEVQDRAPSEAEQSSPSEDWGTIKLSVLVMRQLGVMMLKLQEASSQAAEVVHFH